MFKQVKELVEGLFGMGPKKRPQDKAAESTPPSGADTPPLQEAPSEPTGASEPASAQREYASGVAGAPAEPTQPTGEQAAQAAPAQAAP
ncbi:hypothetical protein, partial [Thiohalocapsa halophila]